MDTALQAELSEHTAVPAAHLTPTNTAALQACCAPNAWLAVCSWLQAGSEIGAFPAHQETAVSVVSENQWSTR